MRDGGRCILKTASYYYSVLITGERHETVTAGIGGGEGRLQDLLIASVNRVL